MGLKDKIDCSKDVMLTQQSSKDECDINMIVERAKRGADITHLTTRVPQYGDFTQIPTDLRECLVMVQKANEAFMTLDPFVRRRFENDPAVMLDFLNDPKNRDEAISLGLVAIPKVIEPPVVEQPVAAPAIADVSGSKKSKAKPVDD